MAGMSFSVVDTAAAATILLQSGLVEVFDKMLAGDINLVSFLTEMEKAITEPDRRAKIIAAIATAGGVKLISEALGLKKSFSIAGFNVRL